jgi:hypothetical protein
VQRGRAQSMHYLADHPRVSFLMLDIVFELWQQG